MKKTLINFGGLLLFYMIIVLGIILLNSRFKELNKDQCNQKISINLTI